LLRPQIVWPFPKIPVEEMLDKVQFVLVPEMNVGQVRKEVERLAKDPRHVIRGLNVMNSCMITAEQIVERVLAMELKTRRAPRMSAKVSRNGKNGKNLKEAMVISH
jgi:pyruvate/2-oxoacid:ferredoxin oxidoreductase alpha subunit